MFGYNLNKVYYYGNSILLKIKNFKFRFCLGLFLSFQKIKPGFN